MYEAGSDVANYIEEAAISAESKMETITELTTEDTLSNITLEDDPFGDDYSQVTRKWFNYLHNYLVITVIIRLILCIFIVSATIFLAVVILRFKRLRTRTNTYILHMCFLHVSFYMLPLLYMLFQVLFWWYFDGLGLFQTLNTALSLYMTFGFMLGLDWFIFARKPHLEHSYTKIFKYVLLGVYFIYFIEWTTAFLYTRTYHIVIMRPLVFTIIYLCLAVALVTLNILKRRLSLHASSKNTEYAFNVANITIFSFIPLLLYHLVCQMTPYVSTHLYIFMLFLEPIPSIIAIGHPVLIVYMLGKQNKHFKMAYNKIFKRSVRNYNDDDLDGSYEEGSNPKVQANFEDEARIQISD